jgi:hypothetical protein
VVVVVEVVVEVVVVLIGRVITKRACAGAVPVQSAPRVTIDAT